MNGTAVYHSPFGKMQLDWEDGAVTALQLARDGICAGTPNELTALVFRQLDEYFAGTRRTFDFPCRLHGTPFQQRSGRRCVKFPTAKRAAINSSPRPSVSRTLPRGRHGKSREPHSHRRPLSPRHLRGRLAGRYAGGTEMKKALLRLEQAGRA